MSSTSILSTSAFKLAKLDAKSVLLLELHQVMF